jgi:hypothetical protein
VNLVVQEKHENDTYFFLQAVISSISFLRRIRQYFQFSSLLCSRRKCDLVRWSMLFIGLPIGRSPSQRHHNTRSDWLIRQQRFSRGPGQTRRRAELNSTKKSGGTLTVKPYTTRWFWLLHCIRLHQTNML